MALDAFTAFLKATLIQLIVASPVFYPLSFTCLVKSPWPVHRHAKRSRFGDVAERLKALVC